MKKICCECDNEITSGATVSTNYGLVWHRICHIKANPPKPETSFAQVLNNSTEQNMVRDLLLKHIPIESQNRIIKLFNSTIVERHIDNVARYETETSSRITTEKE
jgi:hypothetical protein